MVLVGGELKSIYVSNTTMHGLYVRLCICVIYYLTFQIPLTSEWFNWLNCVFVNVNVMVRLNERKVLLHFVIKLKRNEIEIERKRERTWTRSVRFSCGCAALFAVAAVNGTACDMGFVPANPACSGPRSDVGISVPVVK